LQVGATIYQCAVCALWSLLALARKLLTCTAPLVLRNMHSY